MASEQKSLTRDTVFSQDSAHDPSGSIRLFIPSQVRNRLPRIGMESGLEEIDAYIHRLDSVFWLTYTYKRLE